MRVPDPRTKLPTVRAASGPGDGEPGLTVPELPPRLETLPTVPEPPSVAPVAIETGDAALIEPLTRSEPRETTVGPV